MEILFDHLWFDARLSDRALDRTEIARRLSLSPQTVDDIWRGRRLLSPRDINKFARLLALPADQIAAHAGIQSPFSKNTQMAVDLYLVRARADDAHTRLRRLEKAAGHLKSRVTALG
jgi:transcriptional regulator with XRE-family HTH domain